MLAASQATTPAMSSLSPLLPSSSRLNGDNLEDPSNYRDDYDAYDNAGDESEYTYNDDDTSLHEEVLEGNSESGLHRGGGNADDDQDYVNNNGDMSEDHNGEEDIEDDEDEYEYNYSDDDDDGDDEQYSIKSNESFTLSSSSAAKRIKYSSSTTSAAAASSKTCTGSINDNGKPRIELVTSSKLLPEMNSRISEVQEALGVPPEAAGPLLRTHGVGWSVQSLLQRYYDNPTKVLKEAGVFHRCNNEEGKADSARPRECMICMEDFGDGGSPGYKMECGHEFCVDCWKEYIVNSIENENAQACIQMTCPDSTCTEIVTEKEIRYILDEGHSGRGDQDYKDGLENAEWGTSQAGDDNNLGEDIIIGDDVRSTTDGLSTASTSPLLTKFQQYQFRSFVDSNGLARWCPGKGCDRIAHIVGNINPGFSIHNCGDPSLQFVTSCDSPTCCIRVDEYDSITKSKTCQYYPNPNSSFCLSCGEEQHNPATCQQVRKWNDKNSDGDMKETANWLTVNTKCCPKCGTRISKDGGCMYMTCKKCKHGFCWICMGTHHVWNCNAYKETTQEGDEKARVKNELERYLHYFNRFKGHGDGQHFATKQLIQLIKSEKKQDVIDIGPAENPPTASPKGSKKKKSATAGLKSGDDDDATSTGNTTKKGEDDDATSTETATKTLPAVRQLSSSDIFDIRMKLKVANEQLLVCRRVLKWTYVFAYYKFMNLDGDLSLSEKNCFEHHQGILESMTENLSKSCESLIKTHNNLTSSENDLYRKSEGVDHGLEESSGADGSNSSPNNTSDSVQDLANQTRCIKKFITNLLQCVDDGMMES